MIRYNLEATNNKSNYTALYFNFLIFLQKWYYDFFFYTINKEISKFHHRIGNGGPPPPINRHKKDLEYWNRKFNIGVRCFHGPSAAHVVACLVPTWHVLYVLAFHWMKQSATGMDLLLLIIWTNMQCIADKLPCKIFVINICNCKLIINKKYIDLYLTVL